MNIVTRRSFLVLGAVAGSTFFLGGCATQGNTNLTPTLPSVPSVDQLILTSVVDNSYDPFALAQKSDTITVQRTGLAVRPPLLAEHGLAFHLASLRGTERKQFLLDFAMTWRTLTNNYAGSRSIPLKLTA